MHRFILPLLSFPWFAARGGDRYRTATAACVRFAQLHAHALDPLDLPTLFNHAHWSNEEIELYALIFGGSHFIRGSGHLSARATIEQVYFGAQAHSAAGCVNGGVAPADHSHALAEFHRATQVQITQEWQGLVDAF